MNQQEAYGIAKALLLAGGVVSLVLGALGLLGAALRVSGLDAVRPLVGIAVGFVALATMNDFKSEVIQLILIVLGLISGNAGGYIIALAALIALVAKFALAPSTQTTLPTGPTTAT